MLKPIVRDLMPPLVWRALSRLKNGRPKELALGGGLSALTDTQHHFIAWNAKRLNITAEQSLERYRQSWNSVDGGHAGPIFRELSCVAGNVLSVIASDRPGELFESYRLHGALDLLRMVSYPEPSWPAEHPIIATFKDREVSILDYGCGLAQNSRTLALELQKHGCPVRLTLADIPTIRKEFATYLCVQSGFDWNFIDCATENSVPPLHGFDVCFVQEFFEHVYDPLAYMRAFDSALTPGGFLVTNVADHETEFQHVTPDLSSVRNFLAGADYDELQPNVLYRKNSTGQVRSKCDGSARSSRSADITPISTPT
jgi:2-polyprenyl-3-methyl-5-hydroxy-6-metoxy-1,4-benzoquinol methylase